MLSEIRRAVGMMDVREVGQYITVSNIPTYTFTKELYALYSTSKIAQHMFTRIGRNELVFHRFFAPDIAFALRELTLQRRSSRAMRKMLDLLYQNTWLATTIQAPAQSVLDLDQLKNLTVTLKSHQLEWLHVYDRCTQQFHLNGYLLAADPGTGKTIAGLALAECLRADVVIEIVPKNSVDRVWVETINTLYKKPQTYWSSTCGIPTPPAGCRHYVFHYERLEQALEFFRHHRYSKVVILLDESHNFNELDSQRTNDFIALVKLTGCKHVVWSSGTPVKAIGNEVMPLLQTIAEDFDADAQRRFRAIFGRNAKRAIEILSNRMGMVTFRVEKSAVVTNQVDTEEVKVQIPHAERYTLEAIRTEMRDFILERMAYYEEHFTAFEKCYFLALAQHERSLHTDLEKKQYQVYRQYIAVLRRNTEPELWKEAVVYCNQYEKSTIAPKLAQPLRNNFLSARSVYKYYPLKVQGEALGRVLGKRRTECHVAMVPHLKLEDYIDSTEKKTVIFTSYVPVVDAVAADLREKGYSPVVVYGDTNKDLPQLIAGFARQEDANPLIATYQSLSTAVPLVMANQLLMLNAPFRNGEYVQAISRCDRMGQDSPVHVRNFFLDTAGVPNISTRSNDILVWSREAVEQIMSKTGATHLDMDLSLESFQELVPWIPPQDWQAYSLNRPSWTAWR